LRSLLRRRGFRRSGAIRWGREKLSGRARSGGPGGPFDPGSNDGGRPTSGPWSSGWGSLRGLPGADSEFSGPRRRGGPGPIGAPVQTYGRTPVASRTRARCDSSRLSFRNGSVVEGFGWFRKGGQPTFRHTFRRDCGHPVRQSHGRILESNPGRHPLGRENTCFPGEAPGAGRGEAR
jgi:hypothetical protein